MTTKQRTLAVKILKSTIYYEQKQVSYSLTDYGLKIYSTRYSDFHSTNLIPLFAMFNNLLTYNSDSNKIELILF